MNSAKPFLKWAGGKRQLQSELAARIPPEALARLERGNATYHEPFMGGAALFFALQPKLARLSDMNDALVCAYLGVQQEVEETIATLADLPYDRDTFLQLREVGQPDDSFALAAAWFIYMNRCCFNGIWRVNRAGKFNVPFGRYTNPTICDAENLRACSAALRNAVIAHDRFESVLDRAAVGDVVYFDPPYVPVSDSANFTAYTVDGFTARDQARLADVALELTHRGVHVLLSNSDAPQVHKLYRGWKIDRVSARRNVNSKKDKRGPVQEVIIT